MKVLAIVSGYPYPDYPFSGVYNERCVRALRQQCDAVAVFAPRPYAPPLLSSFVERWKSYRKVVGRTVEYDMVVYRPSYLQIPRLGGWFWNDPGMYLCCRRKARAIHNRVRFDAIMSFDFDVAGMAWRLARDLGIPASGWALGSDVRVPASSSQGRGLIKAAKNLDLVFYQSHELLEKVAETMGTSSADMPVDRHIVLAHGIPEPPLLQSGVLRNQVRLEWGLKGDEIIVLYIGRIVQEKGLVELVDAVKLAATKNPRITCVLVGSKPGFDESTLLRKKLDETPGLSGRVRLLPGCSPNKVWDYLCAADIFAFPSYNEGMPNSLLEAMAMGLPAVASAIPPVLDIEGGTGALVTVPPLDVTLLSQTILRLAGSPDERISIGQKAKARVMDQFMVQKNIASAVRKLTQKIEERKFMQRRSHENDGRSPSDVLR